MSFDFTRTETQKRKNTKKKSHSALRPEGEEEGGDDEENTASISSKVFPFVSGTFPAISTALAAAITENRT